MNSVRLNEHDANQGAQSKGEFLGMGGNTAWCLLGAVGVTQMLVIFLWGMLGVPLWVCLGAGGALCGLSLAYVFTLKNNRPEHYDTDFFESALIEAGIMALAFGPSDRRPPNPFRTGVVQPTPAASRGGTVSAGARQTPPTASDHASRVAVPTVIRPLEKPRREGEESPTVPLAAYERLRDELVDAEDRWEDAVAAHEEEQPCT